MNLRLKVKRAVLFSSMDGEDTRFDLGLTCSPTNESGTLEIGDRHVFATRQNRPILSKRRFCNLGLSVMRRSSLTQDSIDMIGLSASKIGNLYFVPSGEKSLFWRSQPAALDAKVFVTDELFERLVSAFLAGKGINWLELCIEKPGVLEFGWEPDGSRKKWKLESTTDLSCVDVESIDIGIRLFEGQPLFYFFALITDVIPSPLLWGASIFLAFIAWRWIEFLLIRK